MNFNQSAFAPYNTMSAPMMSGNGSLWLVLTNIGIHVSFGSKTTQHEWMFKEMHFIILTIFVQVDENTVKMICMRAGNVQTFSSPIGAQFAVVRFKDAALEKIVPRIQQELQPLGLI